MEIEYSLKISHLQIVDKSKIIIWLHPAKERKKKNVGFGFYKKEYYLTIASPTTRRPVADCAKSSRFFFSEIIRWFFFNIRISNNKNDTNVY